jgi:asparagine N-glycosylation enzyme membrane subunit Stt3
MDRFRFLVIAVIALSVGSGLVALLLALLSIYVSSQHFDSLIGTLSNLFSFGVGTICGILSVVANDHRGGGRPGG